MTRLPGGLAVPRGILVAMLSLCCAAACLIPPRSGFREAISLQVARGEVVAWLIIASTAAATVSSIPHMLRVGRYFSAVFLVLVVVGLCSLVRTDPTSAHHLNTFTYMAGGLLLWIWCVWLGSRSVMLGICALASTSGAFACLASLGIGERAMILSTLVALNYMLWADQSEAE